MSTQAEMPLACSLLNSDQPRVVVVELPQAPEDDPLKRWSCAWKAVGLVTVGVCVW